MHVPPPLRSIPSAVRYALALLILVAVTTWGVWLRLQDPLSTVNIAAEDPFTHLVLTREHLERGYAGWSDYMGTFYPPGLHFLLGAVTATTGLDPVPLARFGPPVLFGALSIAGVFLLAERYGGLAAAAVAATAVAVMPEHIFRTNLLFPTALDLALLPFLYVAVVETVEGRLEWAVIVAVIGAALVVAHPWVIPLTALAVGVYAFLRVLAARRGDAKRVLAGAVTLLVVFAGLAWGTRQLPRLDGHYESLLVNAMPWIPVFAAGVAVSVLALLVGRYAPLPVPAWTRGLVGAGAVAVALWALLPRMVADLPRFVDYGGNFGAAVVALAVAGFVLLPLFPSRLGFMGAGITVTTFPFTAINVFNSPFWPHRTMVYLALGVVLLAGSVGVLVARALLTVAVPPQVIARAHATRRVPWRPVFAAAAAGLVLAAGVAQAAPDPYRWYRLYDEESYGAVEWATEEMAADPDAVFVIARWQPNHMLKAIGDPSRVHYVHDFYGDPGTREGFLADQHAAGHTVYVLVDTYHREAEAENGWDLSFTETEGYTPVGTWGHVTIYRAPGPDA